MDRHIDGVPQLADEVLDADHEEFLELILALAAASATDAPDALVALRSHADAHFEREDTDLRRLGGNNAECHLAEHVAVLKSLDEVLEVLHGELGTDVKRTLVRALSDELLRWLPHHVSEMDAELAASRAKARFGGAVIRFTPRAHASAIRA
jgi:hemerythrin